MRSFIKKWRKERKRAKAIRLFDKNRPYFDGYERIYHVHIRKSAGTSINSAFWALGQYDLEKMKGDAVVIGRNYVFVRKSKELIEAGNYYFGNSHIPFWKLRLPEKTYAFCMFREPYERLVSLYKYLYYINGLEPKDAIKIDPSYNALKYQLEWVGAGFSQFLENIPKKHLAHQIHMFSETGNIKEALANVSKLNAVFFQDRFENSIKVLSTITKEPLSTKRERSFGKNVTLKISEKDRAKAMNFLKDEYTFYEALHKKYYK